MNFLKVVSTLVFAFFFVPSPMMLDGRYLQLGQTEQTQKCPLDPPSSFNLHIVKDAFGSWCPSPLQNGMCSSYPSNSIPQVSDPNFKMDQAILSDLTTVQEGLVTAASQNAQLKQNLCQAEIQVEDLGMKVDSLNKRITDDEASLPAAVDQYAVQKLLEKINALEARVKQLERQAGARQP